MSWAIFIVAFSSGVGLGSGSIMGLIDKARGGPISNEARMHILIGLILAAAGLVFVGMQQP